MATSKRNTLAGSKKGTSKSARYFQNNSEAREKKNEYNKKYHSTDDRKSYRAGLNKANKDAGTYGKMTSMNKDRSHTKSGKLVLEDKSKNRARNGHGKDGKRLK
jgi:hypothetical protein